MIRLTIDLTMVLLYTIRIIINSTCNNNSFNHRSHNGIIIYTLIVRVTTIRLTIDLTMVLLYTISSTRNHRSHNVIIILI